MTGFQIVLGRAVSNANASGAPSEPARKLRGMLDLLVDGMNVTARVGEGQTLPFLRDLAHAASDLAAGRRARATVPFYLYDDAWELGLLRDGPDALLSVFRGGVAPEVAVHERRIAGDTLIEGLASALDETMAQLPEGDGAHADLACAQGVLAALPGWADGSRIPELTAVSLEVPSDPLLSIGCDVALRPVDGERAPTAARSDLLPLLVRGRMRVHVRGRTRDLGDTFVFLVAERLVEIANELLAAEASSSALYRRIEVAGVRIAVRLCSDGVLGLTLRRRGEDTGATGETFPGLNARVLAQAVVSFARALSRALVRGDRGQLHNLRLTAFRTAVKSLAGRLRPKEELSSRLNDAPESYRAYAVATRPQPQPTTPGPAKLRFSPRWVATVPAIDLGATFLCGDRVLAQGGRELHCLDRSSGEVLWSRPASRAVSVPTPGGLARLGADGTLALHDYGTGEPTLSLRLSPRVGGAPAGAVVHAPGLPKLLVVTEGERFLSAVDLVTGEVRWRHTLTRGGLCRVRRAGKLLVLASGDSHLTALDVQSGETVWRLCDERPFVHATTFDHDTLFAVAGDPAAPRKTRHKLLAIDAWTGAVRFDASLPPRIAAGSAPLIAGESALVVTRSDRGLGLASFDRATGEVRYHLPPGAVPVSTAWLPVDDAVFANTDQGELLSIDAISGEIRYRLRLSEPGDDAVPRRLEPVLRSGALFVPQREVHVVRPGDGALLGQVPCDLIPDLLRVDERCDVYVAEESGHLAAFGAGPRLSLVKC